MLGLLIEFSASQVLTTAVSKLTTHVTIKYASEDSTP